MQQSWQKIEWHYLEAMRYMPEFAYMHCAMAEFCNWIGKSEMSTSLYGRTSMHSLLISQSKFDDAVHPSTQILKVNPDFETNMVEFRFIDTHLEKRQWNRAELPNSKVLIERLAGFVKQVGWVMK